MSVTVMPAIRSLGCLLSSIKEIRAQWTSGPEPREELWFRGLQSTVYELTPTLYRPPSLDSGFDQVETSLLHDFRSRARGFLGNNDSARRTDWEWYAAARHHGLPSRLLDWTGNVLVALFFALEKYWGKMDKALWSESRNKTLACEPDDLQPCVWVLEAGSLNDIAQGMNEIISLDSKERFLRSYYPNRKKNRVSRTRSNRWPVALYPPRMHERISAQHGYFTLHGHNRSSLQTIAGMKKHGAFLLAQIPIVPGAIPYLIDDLVLCGITHASVYADLDSVGKSVRWSYMQGGNLDG